MSWETFFTYIGDVLKFTLFQIQGTEVSVLSLLMFVIFIGAFILLGMIVRKELYRRVLKRFNIDESTSYTLSRVTQYLIIIVGALISFQFVGVDLSGLAVIFGLLSVGIGFGLQNVTSNFISGLIILFERPISIGDRVMVGDIEGDVTEINIRATKIRTLNNISIIVPNTEFVSTSVINYSHGSPMFRVDINVGVSYGSDLETVLQCLYEVAQESQSVLKEPETQVHLTGFGDSSWNMQLRAWVSNVKNHPSVRNELNQAIVRKFREKGVEIPFPQRDLHVRSSINIPVSGEA